jgi:hypothetical protein
VGKGLLEPDYEEYARNKQDHLRPELPVFYSLLTGSSSRHPWLDDGVTEETYGPINREKNEKSYEDIIKGLHKM